MCGNFGLLLAAKQKASARRDAKRYNLGSDVEWENVHDVMPLLVTMAQVTLIRGSQSLGLCCVPFDTRVEHNSPIVAKHVPGKVRARRR